jgi:hypothetical protein
MTECGVQMVGFRSHQRVVVVHEPYQSICLFLVFSSTPATGGNGDCSEVVVPCRDHTEVLDCAEVHRVILPASATSPMSEYALEHQKGFTAFSCVNAASTSTGGSTGLGPPRSARLTRLARRCRRSRLRSCSGAQLSGEFQPLCMNNWVDGRRRDHRGQCGNTTHQRRYRQAPSDRDAVIHWRSK